MSTGDVLIVGAGPAGALLAARLARPGREVVLVHRDGPDSGVVEETVVGSAAPLFERLGFAALVARRGFTGLARHGTIWGSPELALRPLAERERGYKLVRAVFDADLRALAVSRGARLLPASTAREALPAAKVLVAATGRASPEEAFEGQVEAELPSTLGFTLRCQLGGAPADLSVIEAVREGWWWWLPLKDGGATLTLFADREEVLARGREDVWRTALAGALGPARGVQGVPERGTLASPRLRTTRAEVLLVGDAISSLDPLSSQGVEKALASAEHAALCANTLLAGALEPALVYAHQRAWERRLFQAHARSTLAFYAREQRFAEAPFWRARHACAAERLQTRPRPERIATNAELVSAPALVPVSDGLRSVPGWTLRRREGALHALGALPIEALLGLCDGGVSWSDALARAAKDARLVLRTPREIEQALDQLLLEDLLVPD